MLTINPIWHYTTRVSNLSLQALTSSFYLLFILSNYFVVLIVLFCCCIWTTIGGLQGLLLVLHSGINPGGINLWVLGLETELPRIIQCLGISFKINIYIYIFIKLESIRHISSSQINICFKKTESQPKILVPYEG